jgi:replicative DNA helicase
LQRIGSEIQELSDEDQPAAELVDRAEQKLLSLSRSTEDSKPMLIHEAGEESYERYTALYEADDKSALFGITTGFPSLDHLLAGLPPGHLMIVAARPSVGKTAFAIDIARELQCPIVALSQLSRSCEQRNPPIPVLSDLRESGSIEQDADSVLMLYREGNYNEDCDDPTLTDFYLRKNRNGPTGHIELKFNAARMSFGQ